MEELIGFCEEYVNGDLSDTSLQELTARIVANTRDILHLVQSLRLHLTSVKVGQRLAATRLLSEVLEVVVPSGSLLEEDVHYLIEFLCDRLKDQVLILPHVLAGLQALVTYEKLQPEDVVLIARTIFKECHCQSLQFEDRHHIFRIFMVLFLDHMTVLQGVSGEVVLGYIDLMAGERDPRNLQLNFSSVTLILHHLQYDVLVEELFEVVSCYFPVDFTPPPGSELITREVLVRGLQTCLTATPKFGQLCMPLLLEKLTSEVLSAKLDSLQVLLHGLPVYGAQTVSSLAEPLWLTLKTEMFKSAHTEVQVGCVAAVRAMAVSLSSPQHSKQLEDFITMALQDCGRHLKEPGLRLMTPVVQLLVGVVMASVSAASLMMAAVVPLLLVQYNGCDQAANEKVVLEALLKFLQAARSVMATPQLKDSDATKGYLSSCRQPLLDLLSAGIHNPEARSQVIAIKILSELVSMDCLLNNSQILDYAQHLKDLALSAPPMGTDLSSDIDDYRDVIQNCLATICTSKSELVKDHLIAPLLDELSSGLYNNLWLLPYICPSPEVCGHVIQAVVKSLEHLTMSEEVGLPRPPEIQSKVMVLTNLIVRAICQLGGKGVVPITTPTFCHILSMGVSDSLWLDLMLQLVTACAHRGDSRWCENAMAVLLEKVGGVDQMTNYSTSLDCCYVPVLAALLQAAPSKLVDGYGKSLAVPLFRLSVQAEQNEVSVAAAKAYASILNKCTDGVWLQCVISRDMEVLWECFSCNGDGSQSILEDVLRSLTLLIWLTKALVMRGHREGWAAAQKLLSLCVRSDEIGAKAAEGCGLLMTDEKDLLNEQNHATVRLLFKQQIFSRLLPQLIQLYSQVKESQREHLLVVLSHLLAGVPQQVVSSELHKVLPLLVESLFSESVHVKSRSLEALLTVLSETPTALSSHLQSLLPQLLLLTSEPTSMAVRRLSLQCVGQFTSLPPHLIYPFKQRVIKALASGLNDHKRMVRKAAVDARALWYLL